MNRLNTRIGRSVRAPAVRIVRLSRMNKNFGRLISEYYEAINVTQRDTESVLEKVIEDPGSGAWLAYLNGQAVGCVVLKVLPSIESSAECKRLYVQSQARGLGLANQMLDLVEDFARSKGLSWIYLDSFDSLRVALTLYHNRGYQRCERYNDNPQATIFLRKYIS